MHISAHFLHSTRLNSSVLTGLPKWPTCRGMVRSTRSGRGGAFSFRRVECLLLVFVKRRQMPKRRASMREL